MKVTLLVLTLNEIEGCRHIVPKIRREWVDEILFVDARSTDGTKEWLPQNGYRVVEQDGSGLMGGYRTGLRLAAGDVIIPFSPDNNSVPEVIPQLIEKMQEGYDMVIASRYEPGAGSEDDTLITAFGNRLFTWMTNVIHGGRYTDALVMYRAFRKDLVRDLEIDLFNEFVFETTMNIRCLKKGLRVTSIPGKEPKRIGVKKIGVWGPGAAILYRILAELFVWRK